MHLDNLQNMYNTMVLNGISKREDVRKVTSAGDKYIKEEDFMKIDVYTEYKHVLDSILQSAFV